jgi:hypothetical protein
MSRCPSRRTEKVRGRRAAIQSSSRWPRNDFGR